MLEINDTNIAFWRGVGVVALFVSFGLLMYLCLFFQKFSAELRYLNIEIERTEGAERKYWIRKRRRLWLSLIPFVKY